MLESVLNIFLDNLIADCRKPVTAVVASNIPSAIFPFLILDTKVRMKPFANGSENMRNSNAGFTSFMVLVPQRTLRRYYSSNTHCPNIISFNLYTYNIVKLILLKTKLNNL